MVTKASINYLVVMHCLAHMMKKCNPYSESRHGLTDTDHMWNFFSEHLHPSNPLSGTIFGLG
jgi:hypothetical protein